MDRQLVVNSHADLENNPEIVLHFVENNTISKFYSVEGNEFDVHDADGVWLDKSFADARNLKVGDEISFKSNGTEIKKEIRGLGYSPEYVHDMRPATTVPNHTASGFAYMSHEAFPSGNILYNVLDVKFEGLPKCILSYWNIVWMGITLHFYQNPISLVWIWLQNLSVSIIRLHTFFHPYLLFYQC